jgi:hypothetical protein
MFIAKPVMSRVSNLWTIVASRRITLPDGSFGGIVVAGIDPVYFQNSFAAVDIGRLGAITIFLGDGTLMVRHPVEEDAMGRNFGQLRIFR